MRIGITETSVDQYEIDPKKTELMINTEDDLLQLVEVKEAGKVIS